MSSISKIIHNLQSNAHFSPSPCTWHYDNHCLLLTANVSNKRFHCLCATSATRWVSYSVSDSCDIPEYFHDLLKLNEETGNQYVLPFVTHVREPSGATLGLYEISTGIYAKLQKPEHLLETFLTFVVLLCLACRLHGGHVPSISHMKFVYTERHPVLVDVGSENSKNRERQAFNAKKWKRFLEKKTSRDILHYMKISHPEFFLKKSKKDCVLSGNHEDIVHQRICFSRNKPLLDILKENACLIPGLTGHIESIIVESK